MAQPLTFAAPARPPGLAPDDRVVPAAVHAPVAPEAEQAVQERGLLRRHAELGVALVLLALAALVVWDNLRIGAGWSADTGPQPGYFPLRVGAVLGACGAIVLLQALRSRDDSLFASWLQLKRVAQVLVPLTVYVALIAPLGIYVASTVFIAAFMVFAGRYAVWKGLALAAFTNALLFFVFEIQFKVPLPKGPLEAWLGY